MLEKLKICSKCGEEKKVNEFHKNKTAKDGLCHSCKECRKTTKKEKLVCKHCGELFEKYGRGKTPLFCEKCKEEATVSCKQCGKPIPVKKKHRFCSRSCVAKHSAIGKKPSLYKKTCTICGKEFERFASGMNQLTCTIECRGISRRTLKGTIRKCVNCGKSYEPKRRDQKCCGADCAKAKETKTKRAQGLRILTEEEYAERKRYGWRYQEWRKSVYVKDKYTCQCCGEKKGGTLNAHHIESYSDNPHKRYELNNGITLCQYCHREFHLAFGFGNNNREQLLDFLLQRKEVVATWLKQADHQNRQLCMF